MIRRYQCISEVPRSSRSFVKEYSVFYILRICYIFVTFICNICFRNVIKIVNLLNDNLRVNGALSRRRAQRYSRASARLRRRLSGGFSVMRMR